MSVTVYPGLIRPGLTRVMALFKDGIYLNKLEVEPGGPNGQWLVVTDPLNVEKYRAFVPALAGYAVRSIQVERSAQSGLMVIGIGGFTIDGNTQQALVISTDYRIAEPVQYENYRPARFYGLGSGGNPVDILRGIHAPAWLVGLARGVAEAVAYAATYGLIDFIQGGGLPQEYQVYGALGITILRALEGTIDHIDPAKRRKRGENHEG